MRSGRIVVAIAALVVCAAAGAAKAVPLSAALSRAALQARIEAEPARWRSRHRRDYFWGDGRAGIAGRDDAGPFTIFGATRPPVPEIVPPVPEIVRRDARHRGGWVDPPPE
jgi:hypothetical protein